MGWNFRDGRETESLGCIHRGSFKAMRSAHRTEFDSSAPKIFMPMRNAH